MAAFALLLLGGGVVLLYAGISGVGLVATFQAALAGQPLPKSGGASGGGSGNASGGGSGNASGGLPPAPGIPYPGPLVVNPAQPTNLAPLPGQSSGPAVLAPVNVNPLTGEPLPAGYTGPLP